MSQAKNTDRSISAGLYLLRKICPPGLYEGIEGDLLEKFEEECELFGKKIASRRFLLSVVQFLRPGIILRNRFSSKLINTIMLRSYITIAFRNLRKNTSYSFINIFGLAIGIASCLLIFNYVQFEESFDKTHPDVDQLYRVNQTLIWAPSGGIFTSSGPQLAHALQNDYPEVEQTMRINTPGDQLVRYSDGGGDVMAFRETNVLAADSNFFNFFDFKLKEGDPRTALKGKDKVVISEAIARKFFGDKPALGKILQIGDERKAVEVSGVTAQQAPNIHFHFDYLISMYTNESVKKMEWSFIWSQVVTYVKLRPNTNVADLEEKIQTIAPRRVKPSFDKLGMNYDDFIRDKGGWHFYLQPVKDIRLGSGNIIQRFEDVSDRTYVYIFGGVAIFILLIAAINFVNLSTARATMRAKEVGVKKALGAFRNSLVAQFQIESIVISIMATVLAIVLATVFKPVIFQATGFNLPFSFDDNWQLIAVIVAFPFVLGFIAGAYPAFYLTSFQPIQVLKGKLSTGMKSGGLRNGLVTLQFVIAIALMSVTLLVFQQINFVTNRNLGLDKENVLVVKHAEWLGTHLESFRNDLLSIEGVIDASSGEVVPGNGGLEDIFSKEGSSENLPINKIKIDNHFFKTFGLTLATGREFKEGSNQDSTSIILNENAAKLFGWTSEEALGKYVIYPEIGKLEVVGVVKDFNFRSLHSPISPMLFLTLNSKMWGDSRELAIKFKSGDVSGIMKKVEDKWKPLANTAPIEFEFYDHLLARQYENETRLGGLFAIFACFSIGVGIIGLIGLVAYSAEQRKKEIGIRKVFGASVSRIFVMVNSQYIKLIIIALIIATPLAWWVIQQWLDTFAYHVEISPLVFVIAGASEIILAVLCVGYLSLRAATLNPSVVLKEE